MGNTTVAKENDDNNTAGSSERSEAHLAGISDQVLDTYGKKIISCFILSKNANHLPTTLDNLAGILAEHGRWVRSALNPNATLTGSRAILQGASLRGAALAGFDLRGADLRRADLAGADLQGCNLAMADLSHANLTGALLHGAILTGALTIGTDFSEVDMHGVLLD